MKRGGRSQSNSSQAQEVCSGKDFVLRIFQSNKSSSSPFQIISAKSPVNCDRKPASLVILTSPQGLNDGSLCLVSSPQSSPKAHHKTLASPPNTTRPSRPSARHKTKGLVSSPRSKFMGSPRLESCKQAASPTLYTKNEVGDFLTLRPLAGRFENQVPRGAVDTKAMSSERIPILPMCTVPSIRTSGEGEVDLIVKNIKPHIVENESPPLSPSMHVHFEPIDRMLEFDTVLVDPDSEETIENISEPSKLILDQYYSLCSSTSSVSSFPPFSTSEKPSNVQTPYSHYREIDLHPAHPAVLAYRSAITSKPSSPLSSTLDTMLRQLRHEVNSTRSFISSRADTSSMSNRSSTRAASRNSQQHPVSRPNTTAEVLPALPLIGSRPPPTPQIEPSIALSTASELGNDAFLSTDKDIRDEQQYSRPQTSVGVGKKLLVSLHLASRPTTPMK
jgi:hypothetical protein